VTADEKKRTLGLLRAFERFYFRNLALETILERFAVPNWEAFASELAANKAIQPEVRARFQRLYKDIEHEPSGSDETQKALDQFLRSVQIRGKPN
jgi:hypothetical protein